MSDAPVIRVHEVDKAFGPQKVLNGLSFEVAKGESLVIMGPSGAGKSVILKHLIGLLRPDTGTIEVAGREVPRLRPAGLAELRRDMGYLFQHAALINWLSVYDNVALPLRETTSQSESEINSKVISVLELVHLLDARNKMPSEISGGMQKRVGLARTLVTDPKVILYDEPEAGLDPEMSASVSEMIVRLRHEIGMTSVTVTHSWPCAEAVGDRVAFFEHGKLVIDAPPADILSSTIPRVREFFSTPK
ncbi:MAG: ATP-binding cassette domain-containing protein [Planctomycetes bacterium]|nr:ATP-binding cassette domain-containing protein [Planctomycetota bacterium]